MERTYVIDKTIWDALSKTDPKATKGFKRAGGFSGTAIKPQWVIQRLTEHFGACGVGWGIGEPMFQVVPGHNGEMLVYCTVQCWHGGRDYVLHGVGGDKIVSYIKANEQYNRPERWENDDEAFKKAFTDAVMNAFKFIGVGNDVHMGRFDDSKYVREVEKEFAEPKKTVGGINPSIDIHTDGPDWYEASGSGMSAAKAKAEGWGETLDGWLSAIPIIPNMEAWRTWCRDHDEEIKALPMGWRKIVREAVDARKAEL